MEPVESRRLALGTILKLFRERIRDLSQRQLEVSVGLPLGCVTRFERGVSEPTGEQQERIGRFFGFTPEDWERMARPIASHLATRIEDLGPDGDYPNPEVEPALIVDGASLRLAPPLARKWNQLRADEERVRRDRDALQLETLAYLMRGTRGG